MYKAWIDLNEIAGVAVARGDFRVSRFVESKFRKCFHFVCNVSATAIRVNDFTRTAVFFFSRASISFTFETHFKEHIARARVQYTMCKILLLNARPPMHVNYSWSPQVDRSVSMLLEEAPGENDENDEVAPAGPARKLQAVAVKVLHPGIKGQLKYLL